MSTVDFYEGADYGLEPNYKIPENGGEFIGYRVPAGSFGLALDPRTANQLQEVSSKLSTGAKTIEVQGVMPEVLESMPQQHLKEINRLKQLVGAELTFHGPLVEPTGISQQGWDESKRVQAERQMWSAVERSHTLEPDGNIVVTFHSSNGLPEPRTRVKDGGKEKTSNLYVIDERTGRMGAVPHEGKDYLFNNEQSPDEYLKKLNDENWVSSLTNITIDLRRATDAFGKSPREALLKEDVKKLVEEKRKDIPQLYKYARDNPEKFRKIVKNLGEAGEVIKDEVQNLDVGSIFVRRSYSELQDLFNKAYNAAEVSKDSESLRKLNEYRKESANILQKYKDDATKVTELADEVDKGIQLLRSINAPEIYRPLEKFAIDKASDTFSNLAFKAYNKFKETAPVISIENPPAGSGLNRAEDLRDLVKASQRKFVKMAVEKGMSEKEAQKQAEKLIGVTWDVGHINMIRKYGYDKADLIGQAEKVAPYVKHIHLSDNFGYEHTELPMGMGNVPTKGHLDAIKAKEKKLKHIIETGNWYQYFKTSPLPQTLEAFGSPVYSMKMAPYWNQGRRAMGGYFTGYGQTLPDVNFSTYGAGFSNLPPELGGQMSGRNRLSGSPME